jgi:hypothetical protein
VLEQNPAAGTLAEQGSTVTITIAVKATYPDLRISASAGGEAPSIGGQTVLSVNLENVGEGDASSVSMTVVLPQEAASSGGMPGGCDSSGSEVTCSLPSLEAGDSKSFEIQVMLQAGFPGSSVQGTVTASTRDDENQGNNSADYTITYQDS